MAFWIGLLSVCADGVVFLALAVAVASPRVSQLARPVIATFAFVCAWLMAAGSEAMRAPAWTTFLGGAAIVASIAVITTTLHLWTQWDDGGDVEPGHSGAHGGGGPPRHRPDAPQRGGGGGAPGWWPEFEREFASYVGEDAAADRGVTAS